MFFLCAILNHLKFRSLAKINSFLLVFFLLSFSSKLNQQEQWSEAHEERLDLRRARITEVSRHLASLEESWERGGLPMHMNLAVRNHHYNSINGNTGNGNNAGTLPQFLDVQMNQLKVQNRKLTEEVGLKSERITDLEMERKSLYRELLQQQQQNQQMQQQLLRKQGHILCGNEEVIF